MSPSSNRLRIAPTTASAIASGRGVDGERVEAARRVARGRGSCRSGPRRHDAQRGVGGVALGVEDDHRAALAREVLADARDQVGGLALLDRARAPRCSGGAARDGSSTGPWASRSSPSPSAARDRRAAPARRGSAPRASGTAAKLDRGQLPQRPQLGRRRTRRTARTAAGCPRRARRGGRRGEAAPGGSSCRARRAGSRPPLARSAAATASHVGAVGADDAESAKNSGRCWTSRPPRSSAASTSERSRRRRRSPRSRARRGALLAREQRTALRSNTPAWCQRDWTAHAAGRLHGGEQPVQSGRPGLARVGDRDRVTNSAASSAAGRRRAGDRAGNGCEGVFG